MDDQIKKVEARIGALERRWLEISRLRNVFAVSPNNHDVINYNKALAQWEAGPFTGAHVHPPGTPFNLNRIFHFPINDDPPTQYTKTAANLTTALGLAVTGEIIQIHGPCTLTGDFAIPEGVALICLGRQNITIAGQVTIEDGGLLYNMRVAETANDANAIYGVLGPTTGEAYILYCDISAIQSGAGNAYAIGATRGLILNNGDLIVRHSKLYGSSTSGSGYAGRSLRGRIYSRHNDYYGSTDRWVTT